MLIRFFLLLSSEPEQNSYIFSPLLEGVHSLRREAAIKIACANAIMMDESAKKVLVKNT
jgi:hypothetical protein